MLTLYDCAFSPFARKVRMALEHKGLAFTAVDALHAANREALEAVNPRREVPVLVDGGFPVVNSAQIVAYLEDAYPERPVMPADPRARARARHWERVADTRLDPIVVDLSLWSWANRKDAPPAGLYEAARRDLEILYGEIESALAPGEGFLLGDLSIADIALFPNLHATRSLAVGIEPARFPRAAAWLRRVAHTKLAREDLDRLRAWMKSANDPGYEKDRIFWRGERIEWLLASGFHEWFFEEIRQGRVIWPGQ